MIQKIILGSDHGGYKLKNAIMEHLNSLNKDPLKKVQYEIIDKGCYSEASCDYPDIAQAVAKEVLATESKGILVCGTGIGMSIAANRYEGIRASHCTDTYTARMTRAHNDSNILCLGERVTGLGLALEIVDTWLKTVFEGGRHQKRIDKLDKVV